jgi:DamX protein
MKKSVFLFIYLVSFVCFTWHSLGVIASNKVNTSSTLSFDQIKVAAEHGDADAQYALGYMFYYGKGGAPKDSSLARMWIEKAAARKQSQAVKALALMNGKGPSSGEPKSYVNAREGESSKEAFLKTEQVESKPVEAKAEVNGESLSEHEKMTLVDRRQHSVSHADSSIKGAYTLQLLGSSNKDRIKLLVKDYHLDNAKIYKTALNKKDWYVLLYGQYETKAEARAEAKRLEVKLSLKPWVKSATSIRQYKIVPL